MALRMCPTCHQPRRGRCAVCTSSKRWRSSRRSNEIYGNPEYRAARKEALRRDGHRCRYEGCTRRAAHTHHLIPVRVGGKHTVANLLSVCKPHHDELERRARLIFPVRKGVTLKHARDAVIAGQRADDERATDA